MIAEHRVDMALNVETLQIVIIVKIILILPSATKKIHKKKIIEFPANTVRNATIPVTIIEPSFRILRMTVHKLNTVLFLDHAHMGGTVHRLTMQPIQQNFLTQMVTIYQTIQSRTMHLLKEISNKSINDSCFISSITGDV